MTDDAGRQDDVTTVLELDELPDGARLRSVTAEPAEIEGRSALRVQLTDAVVRHGIPDVDYIDMPTYVVLPVELAIGTIEIDVLGRLTPDAPDFARAFVGVVFHVSDSDESFESVYLRPMNGLKENPPAPRHARGIQYFAFPDWKFQRLRDEYPDGRYEAGVDIAPGEWSRLRVEIDGERIKAAVNGVAVLDVEAKSGGTTGRIGLWVDIGTEAFFSRLVVRA